MSVREAAFTASLLISFLLCARIAPAAVLDGTVLDPSGRPVSGARVALLNSLIPLDERQTDGRGKFEFNNLRGGIYRLVASLPGFSTSTTEIRLREDETRTENLDLELSAIEQHVVVSASLGGALAPEIGSSVSVITANEMEERGVQSVSEVLRGIPGVEVNQTGRRGAQTSAFIRGGNSTYDLVLVDGMEVNLFGGDIDLAPLTADGVDRVEVTRGPASALYGSNAVSGVVNIVSHRGEGPPRFSALAEGGSFTTRRFALGSSGVTHGLSWATNLSRLDSGGVVVNDAYRNQAAFLSLGFSRSPRRQVNFHFFGDANDVGSPGPYGSDPDHLYDAPIFPGGPTSREVGQHSRDKQNLFGYSANYAEQVTTHFRQLVSGVVATNNYYFISSLGDSFSKNLRTILNTRSEITLSSRDLLVAGFEYNHERIKNTFIADARNSPFALPRTSLAYFAENRWNPGSRLFVTTGLRVDDIRTPSLPPDAFGSRPLLPAGSLVKVNPRVSLAYIAREGSPTSRRLGATRLHGSFGTGIRAPNGFELAFTNNPRLKPEKNVSFDSGVEQRFFANRAVLDLTYFYNRFEDQIVVLGGSLTHLSTFTSANLGNARAQGTELFFRLQPTRALEIWGEYTLLDTSILALAGANVALSPFHVGQRLVRRPRNSGAYNATWRRGRLMLNTNATIRGRVLDIEPNDGTFACVLGLQCFFSNKGYTRADAGFSYRLPRGVEIYGRLNNLLNQKYEESFGFPSLHLNFLAGVKVNFPAE
jgi:outer membrane cobalamin receptor